MTDVTGNRGPRPGNEARRSRNTVVNGASKSNYPGGYRAPISSASAVTTGNDLAQARYGYLTQLAALRAQKPVIGQQFALARQSAKDNAIAGMAGSVNSALDRGIVGSSIDAGARAGVLAQRASDVSTAEADRAAALQNLKLQQVGAGNEYYSNLSNIQNTISQEEMANTISAFANNQFDAKNLNYRDILAAIRDQKTGNTPRARTGLQPNPNPGVALGTTTPSEARYAQPLVGNDRRQR